jgi:hypothetical protein
VLARGLVAVAVLVGVNMAMATPASAGPFWEPYTKTSKWHCTTANRVPSGVTTETCIIVNGTSTQAAVIVTNNSAWNVEICTAAPSGFCDPEGLRLWRDRALVYNQHCRLSLLHAGYSRVCFGSTLTVPCTSFVQAQSIVKIRIVGGGATLDTRFSPTRQMCT